MPASIPQPFDVKLMNTLASLLFAAFGVMVLAAGAWWVLRQPFFPISTIRVNGDVTHNNAVTLRANVTPQLAGNFFTVDLAKARAAFESVPWVRKAVVRREFPDALRATLVEHVPVAHWGDEDESRMVNSFGEVFEANSAEADDGLPRISGPDDQAGHVLGMYREMVPIFNAGGLTLEELDLTSRGSWQATLSTGAVIEMGRGSSDEVKARAERFLRSIKQVAAHYGRSVDSVEGADLRHTDGYALRLRGVTVAAEGAPAPKPPPKR